MHEAIQNRSTISANWKRKEIVPMNVSCLSDQPKCTKGFRAHKLDQKDDQRLGGRVGEERQEKEEKRNRGRPRNCFCPARTLVGNNWSTRRPSGILLLTTLWSGGNLFFKGNREGISFGTNLHFARKHHKNCSPVCIFISSDRSSYSDSGLLYVCSKGHFLRFWAFLPKYLVFLFENWMQIDNNWPWG